MKAQIDSSKPQHGAFSRRAKTAALATSILAGLFVSSGPARAATLEYPSLACPSSLQDCINMADAGDRILIASDDPIEEDISFFKSLTISHKPNVRPVITGVGTKDATGKFIVGSDANGAPTKVTLDGISFRDIGVSFQADSGTGHRFVIKNSSVEHSNISGASGIHFGIGVPGVSVAAINNRVKTTNFGISLSTSGSSTGRVEALVTRNSVTASVPAQSYGGIDLSSGDGVNLRARVTNNVIHTTGGSGHDFAAGIKTYTSEFSSMDVKILNNTIDNLQTAGAFHFQHSAGDTRFKATIYNNTVSRSEKAFSKLPDSTANSSIRAGYNNYFNLEAGNSIAPFRLGPRNRSLNPRFVNPAPGSTNYRIKSSSLLRNKGNDCVPGGIERIDAARRFRIDGSHVDIGAFERGAGAPGNRRIITGSSSRDVLTGGSASDVICGLGGTDTLKGLAGSDRVYASAGNDVVRGGRGADKLSGGTGRDDVYGEGGRDRVNTKDGVRGNDLAHGGSRNDSCTTDRNDTRTSC